MSAPLFVSCHVCFRSKSGLYWTNEDELSGMLLVCVCVCAHALFSWIFYVRIIVIVMSLYSLQSHE